MLAETTQQILKLERRIAELSREIEVLKRNPAVYDQRLPTDALYRFIAEFVFEAPGHLLPYAEFYLKFIDSLPLEEKGQWSRYKVSRALPARFRSGFGNHNKTFIINASWTPVEPNGRYAISSGRILRVEDAAAKRNINDPN